MNEDPSISPEESGRNPESDEEKFEEPPEVDEEEFNEQPDIKVEDVAENFETENCWEKLKAFQKGHWD